MLVGGDHDMEWRTDVPPLVDILPVLVEDLDTAVRSIRDVYPAPRVDVYRVWQVELSGIGSLRTPSNHEFAVFVELDDTAVHVSIGDEESTIRKPRHVGRPSKVLLIHSLHTLLAKCHHELFSVVRKLEDLLQFVINDPHVLFWVVRVDFDLVGATSTGK